jgi:hypothetical protein
MLPPKKNKNRQTTAWKTSSGEEKTAADVSVLTDPDKYTI